MPPILNAQGLSKAYGANPLFQNVSFTVSEGDRIGLIGPNGSGKTTLLRILAGETAPDTGDVAVRKRARMSTVLQESQFAEGETVQSIVTKAVQRSAHHEADDESRTFEILGRAGFEDFTVAARALSGGWRKRLAIVEALGRKPRRPIARRADQSSGPCWHRVA